MTFLRRHRADLGACSLLFLLPFVWLLPVLLVAWTGLSVVPYDTLALQELWHPFLSDTIPHNAALGDVLLQNHAWRHLLRTYVAEGTIPLWNPHGLTGTPFLAGGQAGSLYPPAILLLLGDPDFTYALFLASHLALAGISMFLFGRTLHLGPLPACLAGLAWMWSGFTVTHAILPTVIATVAWLPLILAMIEMILRKQQDKGPVSFRPIPYLLLGAGAITMSAMAWNPEFFAYAFLFGTSYTMVRLVALYRNLWRQEQVERDPENGDPRIAWFRSQALPRTLKQCTWLGIMLVLGLSMAAVQIIPFVENTIYSFQDTSTSFQTISDLAWPKRQILTFWVPNAYGNPSHHRWFDFWQGNWEVAPLRPFGSDTQAIDWGLRSYAVGATYAGFPTWILALIGFMAALLPQALRPVQRRTFWLMLVLGGVALLFALGTPLYRLLYAIPGWSVIRSAHNWSFLFTFCLAMLGGLGTQSFLQGTGLAVPASLPALPSAARSRLWRTVLWTSLVTLTLGCLVFLVLLVAWWQPDWFAQPIRKVFGLSEYARQVFPDTHMFLGYQMGNALHLGMVALGTGLLLLWGARYRPQTRPRRFYLLGGLLLALLAGDLMLSHGNFLAKAERDLSPATVQPPVVQFLEDHAPPHHEWRVTTMTKRNQRFLPANLGFYWGWHDLRGKTFLIPRPFQQTLETLGQTRWRGRNVELNHNRAGYLYSTYSSPAFLESQLLDLWNVRYLITPYAVPDPEWQEIYADDQVRVFENREVFPRTFLVPHAVTVTTPPLPFAAHDLRTTVLLEGDTPQEEGSPNPPGFAAVASIADYGANEVVIEVETSHPAWLILADAHFPGWKAFLQATGDSGPEQELPVLRAYGSLRAVSLSESFTGTVRFVYSPLSVRVGLFFSFLALICAVMLLLWWGWGKYRRTDTTLAESVVVAKNFVVPLNLTFITRGIDFAFAMFYVRLLGPVGTGQFAFVVALYGIFELISRFGLDTLLTREVARDKALSSRYLTNVCILRTGIWAVTSLLMLGVTLAFWWVDRITVMEVNTILIFAVAMLFAGYSDALSAAFHAYEKMEYPAILTTISALIRAGLGALVLLLGWGLPAIAWVAVFTVIIQVIWFYVMLRRTLFPWQWESDSGLQRWMFGNSFPFMVNSLLANILLNIDIWLLRLLSGEVASGLYSVALKYRFGITLIPSMFNFAVFPLFSRYARQQGDGLMGAYRLSIRLLTILSLPIAFGATILAKPLALVVGGAEFIDVEESVTLLNRTFHYTGGSHLALQVVIWTIVLNFINALTQYVLIALDQQRYLTRAFAQVVIFNIVGNILFIPTFGYVGAAVVTILSELFLFVPFQIGIRRHLGEVGWWALVWKPGLGLGAMLVIHLVLHALGWSPWLTGLAAGAGFLGTLYLTGELKELLAFLPWQNLKDLIRFRSASP